MSNAPTQPSPRQQAVADLSEIINAALEHVPATTRGILTRMASHHIQILAAPDADSRATDG
jgi:hypothetical protein